MTNVLFDGTDIQTNFIHISNIDHESVDQREIQFERLGSKDGAKLVDDTLAPKVIRLSGTIKSSDGTKATMEGQIDEFKRLLHSKERNLDIEYASGYRRYTASCTSHKFARDFFNVTFSPWEAEFTVSDPPLGTNLDSSTIEYDAINRTIGTWVTNATFDGTYRPFPTIQITVNSETNLTQISFTNTTTNQQIKVAADYAASDVLLINVDDYTVSINGSSVDYEGVLPDFEQGGNDFRVGFISDNHNVTMKLLYYPLWL